MIGFKVLRASKRISLTEASIEVVNVILLSPVSRDDQRYGYPGLEESLPQANKAASSSEIACKARIDRVIPSIMIVG